MNYLPWIAGGAALAFAARGRRAGQGLCFPWALNYITKHPDALLLQGKILEPGSSPPNWYWHAWIIHNGRVKDWQTMEAVGVNTKFQKDGWPVALWMETFTPSPGSVEEYDREEAWEACEAAGMHAGPWHGPLSVGEKQPFVPSWANLGRRAAGGVVTWPTFRKHGKARVDDYKQQYPDAQVEFDSKEARQRYDAKVKNTNLALETARMVQALLRKRLRATQPDTQVKLVGGLALGTFFDKAPRAKYDLDFLIEGFDPLLYDLRGNPLVYGRERVGSDLGYATRDAGNLISKRNKLPGHGKASLDVFLLDPSSGLLWVYERGYLRRSEKGEFGKNKARDQHGFARGSILAWDDFQRQFMRDARKGLTNRRATRKSLIEAAQGICTPGNHLNCKLFAQLLTDTPRLQSLPVTGREHVGDVLQYGSNPARHWAVYIGSDEVLHVPEWGGALEIASWDAVAREHGPPIIRKGRRATQTCTEGRTDPDLWAKVKAEVTAGSKGGNPGQWSARKAQMAVQKYKSRGGTYCGPKTKAQKSLTRWTKENWGSDRKGDRYLPEAAREALTDAEYRRTSAKKRRDTAKGKQFSKQPPKIARKTAKHRGRRAETYPWLSLAKIKKYEQLMRDRGVSEVARSPRGFLTAYKRAGSKTRLSPEWRMKRDGFVARHWTQAQKQARPLYETKGKYAGTPTRWHLALIAWGFSPNGAKGL